MKIAYLASSIIPSRSANSVHVMHMCEAFAELGHEVQLVVRRQVDKELEGVSDLYKYYGVKDNFSINRFRTIQKLGGSLRKFSIKRGFSNSIKKFNPDIVYGRTYEGCAIAVEEGIPTCLELHGPADEKKQVKPYYKTLMTSPALKRLVVISAALLELVLQQKYVPDSSKFIVAHDAAPPVRDSKSVPENLVKRPGALQVGYAGGLYPGRGVEQILEMASRLSDMDFHMMGGSPEDIEGWKDRGVPSNVLFHGHVPAGDIARYRNACDVLLAPYQEKVAVYGGAGDTSSYMSPLKIFEYMASGKLMLVSDMPVLREVLDGSFCILLPPRDVSAWVSALESARDEKFRKQYSERALKVFKEKYTWQVRAKNVLAGL